MFVVKHRQTTLFDKHTHTEVNCILIIKDAIHVEIFVFKRVVVWAT